MRGLPKVTVRIELCPVPSALCALKVLAQGCHAEGCISDLGVTLWSGCFLFSLLCTPKGRCALSLDALSMKMDFIAPGRCFAFKEPWAAVSRTSEGRARVCGRSDACLILILPSWNLWWFLSSSRSDPATCSEHPCPNPWSQLRAPARAHPSPQDEGLAVPVGSAPGAGTVALQGLQGASHPLGGIDSRSPRRGKGYCLDILCKLVIL